MMIRLTQVLSLAFIFMFIPVSVCIAQDATPVAVVIAKQGTSYQSIPLTGTVNSIRVSQISSQVAGYIKEILVDEGDEVKAGDPILHFDHKLAEIELASARAELSEAQAKLKESKRQRDEAERLTAKKHIAETTYEASLAGVEINTAVVGRLREEVRRQQELLNRHKIFAPLDGVITQKRVEIGQWVDTNTALVELIEINPLRVEVQVPQYYFEQVHIGTPVKVQFDAMPGWTLSAQVTVKVPRAQESGRTFPVKIDIDNNDRMIAPGMSARVHFLIDQSDKKEVILLPADTIIKKPDGSEMVWTINEHAGQVRVTPVIVKTGKLIQNNLEIISGGIKIGDRIVIKGNEILQPGQVVRITEEINYTL